MHLDEYVHQVEERIAGENVRLGWHNRMSENRRVMAEQMKEIAVALKSSIWARQRNFPKSENEEF